MEEEKTRREVQVKHALRAERDSRDDRKRNRDATSVYTHIYIYNCTRTASIFGRSLDYHPITIPILKQRVKSDFQSGNFHSFAFVPPKAAHRSSKILSSLSSLWERLLPRRSRNQPWRRRSSRGRGERMARKGERREGSTINLRNASLPLDLSRSNISPVLIRPKRQASTRCRSLSRRLFGDLIFRGETNDATEDTTCRDDSSVFTNAQRITRKLSSREPLDNREEGNGAKGMERAEGEEEREREGRRREWLVERFSKRRGRERKEGGGSLVFCRALQQCPVQGPGVLFQYNGREKSSIIPGKWEKEAGERKRGEEILKRTMGYTPIYHSERFFENCSSMSLPLRGIQGKMEF